VTFFSALQLFPTIPFRVMDLGGTKAQAGFFLAAYTYASALSAPLMGALADSLGRKRVVVIGALGFVVFSVLYGTVTHLGTLLVVAAVHGTLWSGLLSASGAMISEVIPASRRTEGLAYWGIAATAAVAVAPPIGLALYERSWLALCLGMAALSLVVAGLGARLPRGEARAGGALPPWKGLIDWRVLVTATTLYVISFGYGGITSYVAILADERAVSPRSLFFTVLALTMLLTRIAISPLGDRFGPRALLLPSVGVIPVALGVLSSARSVAGFVLSAFLYGIGFGGAYPSFVTWVLGRTDPARRAATFGAVLFAFDIGIGTGSLVTGLLAERFGFTTAFAVAAAVSAGSIPIFWMTSPLLPAAEPERS
jgi:MFS family permease